MFSKKTISPSDNKSRVGTVLDTDLSKKMYTTYVSKEVLENEIYNHSRNFVDMPHDTDLNFAQNFIDRDGKFIYCSNKQELKSKFNQFCEKNNLTTVLFWEDEIINILETNHPENKYNTERLLGSAKLAVSRCESLVSDEGSIILNPNQNRYRAIEGFPEFHVILASKNQIKLNIDHAVSDYILTYPDLFPFIIDLSVEEKKARFAINKPVLNSQGTKKIIIFYCEECSF